MLVTDLPPKVIELVALYSKPKDIVSFASCSKAQYNSILTNETFWKSKALLDFGDLFKLYSIFVESTGLELPTDLSKKFGKEPESWRQYYSTKHVSINNADTEVLLDQANKEYLDAQKHLTSVEDERNYSVLIQTASKMLWILDIFPSYPGSYYILSFILFIVNRLEDALEILDIGRIVDPHFKAFDELEKKIILIMEDDKRGQEDLPLLANESLTPEIINVLLEIFDNFDKDRDDCLKPEELDLFVFSTNGQHPPASFIEQMGQRFGANDQGWLTKKGFLAFYLEQTLGDPSETKKDIRAHGYDDGKLKKKIN